MGNSIHAVSDREADEYELKLQRKLMRRCWVIVFLGAPVATYFLFNPLFGLALWIAVVGVAKQALKHRKRARELRTALLAAGTP